MPPIPNVPEELREPISALVRMSYILRGVLVEVLDAWSEHLNLTWDDETN